MKDRSAAASNLLWRWTAHVAGEEAFEKSFPSIKCADPLWRAMDAVRDRQGSGGAFDSRTFTDRIRDAGGSWAATEDAQSPASP